MNIKDFKAGLIAGAKPFEDKFREVQNANIAALQKLACENANTVGELIDISEEHDFLLNYDWKKEYELSSYAEKSIFLGLLKDCITLMELILPNEEQKSFLTNLYKLFQIDYSSIKQIDISKLMNNNDICFQKLLYTNICIYFYLSTKNFKFEKKYAKEIFNYFSVSQKDKEEIQKMIKWSDDHLNLVDFFDNEETQNVENPEIEYHESICNKMLNEEESSSVDIKREIASIFFNKYRDSKYFCTSSYIVFNSESKLFSMNKETGIKNIIFEDEDINNDIFDKKIISSYNDFLVFYKDAELCLIDLRTGNNEKISIGISNITNLKTNGKIIAFTHECSIKYLELNTLDLHEIKTDFAIEERSKFQLYGQYIIFLGDEIGNGTKAGYRFYKYNTENSEVTPLSRCFNMEKIYKGKIFTDFYNVYEIGIYRNTLYAIISWNSINNTTDSQDGFRCYKCDLNHLNDSKIYNFYIWEKYIYDLHKYKEFLIYNNASKNYTLISHSIITDGKKTIAKKYGYNEKSSISDRFMFGKEEYQKPRKYYHLENWLLLLNGLEEKLVDINYLK